MITEAEVRREAGRQRVDPMLVDLDYVLGCFLGTLYRQPDAQALRFKGGTCLRKCYFGDYRFSEDLDFTLTRPMRPEALAALFFPLPRPWRVRDGLYHHSFPVVSGGHAPIPTPPDPGDTLPSAKAENELRVLVFGESSVQGAPWGLTASPPAMLHDLLREALPERQVTVVNMGRGSAMTMDAYYYLIATSYLDPDVIVFYQGTNDRYDSDGEMCAPATSPSWHHKWRWLVDRSHLLWTARVFGPSWFRGGEEGPGPDDVPPSAARCPPSDGFRAWTRVLLRRAELTGARVFVTTPVQSDITAIEFAQHTAAPPGGLAEHVRLLPPPYRRLLGCALSADCRLHDVAASFFDRPRTGGAAESEEAALETLPDAFRAAVWKRADVARLGAIWREAADEFGATTLDFDAWIRRHQPRGLLLPPFVVDTVHLSLDGYWLLAYLWSEAILGALGRRPPPDIATLVTPEPPCARYVARMAETAKARGVPDYCAALRMQGKHWTRARMLLIGVGLLRRAENECHDPEARTILDWLRWRLGEAGDATPAHVSMLRKLDIDALLTAERR